MSQPHTTLQIGWKHQPTKGTDSITTAVYYILGIISPTWAEFPKLINTLLKHYRGTSYDPYYMSTKTTLVMGTIPFIMTQPLIPIMFLNANAGSVTNPGTGLYQIDPQDIDGSEQEYFSVKWTSANSGTAIRKCCVDSKFSSMSIFIPGSGKEAMTCTLQFLASKMPTNSQTGAPLDPVDDTAVDYEALALYAYKWSSSCILNWGGTFASGKYSSGGTELKTYMLDFSFNETTLVSPDRILGQHYPNWLTSTDRIYGFTMNLLRTDDTTMFDDHMSQADDIATLYTTPKNLYLKILNSHGQYLEIHMNDVWIESCNLNIPAPESDEPTKYVITGFIRYCIFYHDGSAAGEVIPASVYAMGG